MASAVPRSIPLGQSPRAVPGAARLRRTRLAFFALCCYLAAQVIQVPIRAVGPSWAVWPTLTDLAIGLLALSYLVNWRRLRIVSAANARMFPWLAIIVGGTAASLAVFSFTNGLTGIPDSEKSASAGIFQTYRLAQFVLVFRVAAGIPLDRRRLMVLSRLVDVVLVMVVVGVVATSVSVLDTSRLVAHLPYDSEASGPWSSLASYQNTEIGAIGYNHGYTALHIMVLTALSLSLRRRSSAVRDALTLLLCSGGVFLTGSRAGMAAVLFFAIAYFCKRPGSLAVALVLSLVLLVTGAGMIRGVGPDLQETIERQLSLKKPLDADNLSGRRDIWRDSLAFLEQDPVRWIIGAGPGSVMQYGNNAHMLYLHIVMEAGVVGLMMFGATMRRAVRYLRRFERGARPMLLATIAFLISSLTQETFYPVPALGHFLGFYLCSLALALRPPVRPGRRPNTTPMEARHA